MEVLNSTDVIGEEIKEEARKKAERVLSAANIEIERLRCEGDKKLAKLKSELDSLYKEKIKKYKDSVFITLPLQKWKKRMFFMETELNNALENYFTSLDVEKRLTIIKAMLEKFKSIILNKSIIVKYSKFEKSAVLKLVMDSFTECTIKECKEATKSEMNLIGVFEGIIIEDVENTFICKAGIEQAKKDVFDKIKDEARKALFGGALI